MRYPHQEILSVTGAAALEELTVEGETERKPAIFLPE